MLLHGINNFAAMVRPSGWQTIPRTLDDQPDRDGMVMTASAVCKVSSATSGASPPICRASRYALDAVGTEAQRATIAGVRPEARGEARQNGEHRHHHEVFSVQASAGGGTQHAAKLQPCADHSERSRAPATRRQSEVDESSATSETPGRTG